MCSADFNVKHPTPMHALYVSPLIFIAGEGALQLHARAASLAGRCLETCAMVRQYLRNGEGHGAWCGVNRGLASPRSGR